MHTATANAPARELRPLSVLILSPVRVVALGIAAMLRVHETVGVVGCATSWQEARAYLISAHPELILIDASSIGTLQCVAALRQVHSAFIVAFGVPEDGRFIATCARSGVSAFCDVACDERELVDTIVGIRQGELALRPTTAALLFRRLGVSGPDAALFGQARLTQRELDVLSFLQAGASNKEIATRLGVSVATAKNHVHSILQKLGLRGRAETVGLLGAKRPGYQEVLLSDGQSGGHDRG